jgi:hypothetical protein
MPCRAWVLYNQFSEAVGSAVFVKQVDMFGSLFLPQPMWNMKVSGFHSWCTHSSQSTQCSASYRVSRGLVDSTNTTYTQYFLPCHLYELVVGLHSKWFFSCFFKFCDKPLSLAHHQNQHSHYEYSEKENTM